MGTVPLLNALYAKSMPKAWATIKAEGNGLATPATISVVDGFNIDTAGTILTPDPTYAENEGIRVSWKTAFPTANYCLNVTIRLLGTSFSYPYYQIQVQGTGSVDITFLQAASGILMDLNGGGVSNSLDVGEDLFLFVQVFAET